MESLKSHLEIGGDNFAVEHNFISNCCNVVLRVLGEVDDFVVLGPVQTFGVNGLANG